MLNKILFVIFFSTVSLFGQAETLLSNNLESGGFGGAVVKFTQVNSEVGLLGGGRGGWLINHTFIIGGGGYGLTSSITPNLFQNGKSLNLIMGYGGVEMEYIYLSNSLLHTSIYLLLGGGGLVSKNFSDVECPRITDNFWVANPSINVEINVTSFFRITVGAGYRFVTGVTLGYLMNSDIAGAEGVLTFKFGKF
jgi:hypothetical protein